MEGCNDCQEYSVAQAQDGAPGQNAFGVLAADFIQPASGATVDITVVSNTVTSNNWMAISQPIFIRDSNGNFGFYVVTAKTGINQVQIVNLGYAAGVGPGITVLAGAAISPTGYMGLQGPQGNPGPPGTGPSNASGVVMIDSTQYQGSSIGVNQVLYSQTIPIQLLTTPGDTIVVEYQLDFTAYSGGLNNISFLGFTISSTTGSYGIGLLGCPEGGWGKITLTITYLGDNQFRTELSEVYSGGGFVLFEYNRDMAITTGSPCSSSLSLQEDLALIAKQTLYKQTLIKKIS